MGHGGISKYVGVEGSIKCENVKLWNSENGIIQNVKMQKKINSFQI